jgi:hypothetical protein
MRAALTGWIASLAMASTQLSPLHHNVPIVDPETGNPTPFFQQMIQQLLNEKGVTDDLADGAIQPGTVTTSGLTAAAQRLLGNKESTAGAIEELTLSQALDLIGSAARGDLLFRGASGWQRLAAGTSGQFLKTLGAGADPAWASGGAGGSFRGALVTKAAQQSGANYSGVVAIAWDSEVYDTDGIHDPVTNNTRLTVPSGVTKVRLQANVDLTSVTGSSDHVLLINKNGGVFTGTARQRLNAGVTVPSHNICSAVVNVAAGDYFEVVLFASDTSIDIRVADGASWFAMEIIE